MLDSAALVQRLIAGIPNPADVQEITRRATVLSSDAMTRVLKDRGNDLDAATVTALVYDAVRNALGGYASSDDVAQRRNLVVWLITTYPETVLPLGFDQVRYTDDQVDDPDVTPDSAGLLEELRQTVDDSELDIGLQLAHSVKYRTPNGTWHGIEGVTERLLPRQSELPAGHREMDDWWTALANAWTSHLKRPSTSPSLVMLLPSLACRDISAEPTVQAPTERILRELAQNGSSIRNIHWRTLEELVADLLRDMGLDVKVTERTHDGGRDVIARGELIPG